jgi:hypothetical protein
MQNRAARFGPAAITSTGATILNCALTSNSGTTGFSSPTGALVALYILLTHIRVVNTTAAAITVSMFIGTSTVASTSALAFAFNGYSIAANSYVDWYGRVRLDAADYLGAYASAASLTWQGEGEIGLN